MMMASLPAESGNALSSKASLEGKPRLRQWLDP